MKKNYKFLMSSVLRPYRGRIVMLCVFTLLLSVLQVSIALLSRFVIDAAIGVGSRLVFWGVILLAANLAFVAVQMLLSWYTASSADRLCARMRKDILRTAVYSRNEKVLDHHSGELLSRGLDDVYTLCDGAVGILPSFVGQVTRLIASVVAVVLIAPKVALVMIFGSITVALVTAAIRPFIKKRQRAVRESDEQLVSAMQEDLQQLELIQSIDAQEQTLKRFNVFQHNNLYMRFKRRLWAIGSSSVINLASSISGAALLLWGASRIMAGALSYGSLTAMIQLLGLFRSPAVGLSGVWAKLATVEVSCERLEDLIKPMPTVQKQKLDGHIQQIVLENVTFAYPGDEAPVLEDFSCTLPLGDWSCLTGMSGRGKTTVFKLILGLYAPQKGRIYIQTSNGTLNCTDATRHLFAYVPQDYALFSGTVLENFQLIDPDVTEEDLRRIFQVAKADFVWELTDGLQTQVKENNAGLSKGQLQRLAIARAVLMDRPVFLLDECTSALDAGTEEAVLKGLKSLGKKAILVTHRPEVVQELADVIFVSME